MASSSGQTLKEQFGKLTKEELPARMQGMLTRGDTDKDGTLTRDEILALERAGFDAVIVSAGSIADLVGDVLPDDPI